VTDSTVGRERLALADRVCIVLLSGIGDVVHGLPVAVALKRDRPSRTVVWVAQPAPAEVLRHHPSVDEVVVVRPEEGIAAIRQLWNTFQAKPCEVTFNMQRYAKAIFPTCLSGASVRVGMAPSRTRDFVRFFNTEHTPEGNWRHTQELFLEFLDQVGIERPNPLEWRITLSADEKRGAKAFFAELGEGRVVGLALATANPRKDWLPDRYVDLARALEEEFGFRVLLLGGPGKTERQVARAVMEDEGNTATWGLSDSVRRLIWSIRGCDLVVSPDTSTLHIAHALNVPVIGLFGHTNPWRVGPYERYHDLILDRYSEPGELPDSAHYTPRHERMERITVADVVERVRLARQSYGVCAA